MTSHANPYFAYTYRNRFLFFLSKTTLYIAIAFGFSHSDYCAV